MTVLKSMKQSATLTAAQRLKTWLRPEISALQAYHVPDATGLVKLDAMENPYGWPPALVEQWLAVVKTAALNRYPDPESRALVASLRRSHQLPAEASLLLGNGSDELIQLIMLAVVQAGRVILAPEPGFSMYHIIATTTGMNYVGVPLTPGDFSLDVETMLAAIEQHQPAVVFLAYPNNPTGNLFDAAGIERIISAAPGLVVVDEAYHAFAGSTLMPLVSRHDNLLILRTLSKLGLAGLRLGLLIGAAAWLDELNKIRLPYNINVLTQLSAEFALQHEQVLLQQTQQICHDRELLYQALQAHDELTVFPSRANFILFRTPHGSSGEIFASLLEQGILIKQLHKTDSVLHDCLRVTVGTATENQAFLQALSRALAL